MQILSPALQFYCFTWVHKYPRVKISNTSNLILLPPSLPNPDYTAGVFSLSKWQHHLSCFLGQQTQFSSLSLQGSDFISFGYILKSGISGSYGGSTVNFLRNLHTGCTDLHSYQQCIRVPYSLRLETKTIPTNTCYLLFFFLGLQFSYCGKSHII